MDFDRILTELWCEKFEWFDPSPIEPFNLGQLGTLAYYMSYGTASGGAGMKVEHILGRAWEVLEADVKKGAGVPPACDTAHHFIFSWTTVRWPVCYE